MDEWKFISIIDKDIVKIDKFVEKISVLSKNILTGINFIWLKDDTIFLGLSFYNIDEDEYDKWLQKAKKKKFIKVTDKEENFLSLIPLSRIMFLGDYRAGMWNL